MEINVLVNDERVIPETAELIGWSERSVRDQLKRAQKDGRSCVFKAKVTPEQWDNIVRRKANKG